MIDWLIDSLPIFMMVALALVLLLGYPVAFVLAGLGVVSAGIGYLLGEFPLIAFFNVPLRVWGSINGSLIYPAVPMLLFMGIALERSGVAQELLECLQRLLRRVPANLAVSMTIMGIILAPSAGLVGASVVTLALIGLPTMLNQGYRASIATGSVAAAGTLGIVLPPGVMLFVLADLFRVQIAPMFMSTLLPAFGMAGLFILYYIVSDLLSSERQTHEVEPWDKGTGAFVVFVVRSLFLPIALVMFVLGSIVAGWASPTQSAAVGALGGLIILGLKGRLTLPVVHQVLLGTAMTSAMVFFIIVAATVFSYPFNYFGGPDLIGDFLRDLGLNDWGMLLVILLITFILGFFIDWIEVFVVALPIFLPILRELDFVAHVGSPELATIWLAVLFALVLQTSFMTPPFGFSLFFVKGAAPPSVSMVDIYKGVAPMVCFQLVMIAAVLVLPWLVAGPASTVLLK
ncbi:MAG: TRAP transporter large permease subunit [Pseudomonadota bacterium]